MLLRAALSIEGFDVELARNGYEALQRIDRNPPQVVLLDLGLPDVDGLTVLDDLAARPDTRRIPVVVVTGRTEPLDNLDARCILRKPVSPETVVSVARACLENTPAPPPRRADRSRPS
jgi:CheY-like chemotaxis protein